MPTRPHLVPPTFARPAHGFTLIELLIGIVIGSMLVAGLMTAFITQRRTLNEQEQIGLMQQNTRSAMELLARDVAMAGYGVRVSDYWLPEWIHWESDFTANPTILDGADGDPDSLLIAAAFDPPVTTLSSLASAGSTTLQLTSDGWLHFNTSDRSVVFLGRSETVRVLSVSGTTLTVSSHPTETKGLRYSYPSGTALERVTVRHYTHEDHPGQYPFSPYLARTDSGETYSHPWTRMLAGDIDDMQFVRDTYSVLITITGRTTHPDERYRDPDHGDRYRRLTLTRRTFPRNQRTR